MDLVNNDSASVAIHDSRIIPPDLYEAAAEGNIEPFKENTNDPLEELVTPIKNTSLHIYLASPDQTEKAKDFVEQILEICPPLLMKVNDRGDTPLHLAVKLGQLDIVKVLIEVAKSHREDVESDLGVEEAAKLRMLRKKNKMGNTALHEAVKNSYPDVLDLLAKEDPDYSYSANDSGESPLFIATEVESLIMVKIILENFQSASHEGPDGKTTLHVAARSNNLDITRAILERNSGLTKAADNNGWTPLHYAAYYGYFKIVQLLLESDECVAFVADKGRQMTPLHLAAGQGFVNIMEAIVSCRPDCCEMVDVRGWNFLHFAFTALNSSGMSVFLRRNSKFQDLVRNLINGKDIEGNTPLHVYAVCHPYIVRRLISRMKNAVRRSSLNSENDSISGTRRYGSPKLQKEIDELKVFGNGPYRKGIIRSYNRWTSDFIQRMEKGREAQLVVSALVATVTFAAALTVPGGFDQEKGTALLTKNAAFQAFIVTDAIAMICSLFAVFLHFIIILDLNKYGYLFTYTIFSTIIAIIAMVIAFATGTYAVLRPSSGLAVAATCIGLTFFVLLLEAWRVYLYHFQH